MESSTVLAFRIFVMLSCLIIVPMAAIFGSAFPDVVKSISSIGSWRGAPASRWKVKPPKQAHRPTQWLSVPASTCAPPPANGKRRVGRKAGLAGRLPTRRHRATGAGQCGAGSVVPASAAGVYPAIGNQSASFDAPADSPAARRPIRCKGPQPKHPFALAIRSRSFEVRLRILATRAKQQHRRRAVRGASTNPIALRPWSANCGEYGATYYLLETWGNEGQLYRFHCRMAISNNPNYTRQFEATDRDALKAMSQVLERVEAWRTGRLQ